MKLKSFLLAILLLAVAQLHAEVTLYPIFTDNMVLQQKTEVRIWGNAAPGKTVTVETSWNDALYTAKADAEGAWSVKVSTPSAGGPYTITFAEGSRKKVLENVLIGEVWICSGQSNMEMMMRDKVTGYEKDLAESSKYTEIRILHVDKATSPAPLNTLTVHDGGWQVCNAENLDDFSATAYYFGRYLNEGLDIPVGLIETCWGGTVAEAWTDAESLGLMNDFESQVKKLPLIPVENEGRQALFEEEVTEWKKLMHEVDPGFKSGEPLWAAEDFDDSEWKPCTFPGFLQFQGFPSTVGFFWVRKTVDIPASWEGKELTLHLGAPDDNDFTYFNGQEIGHQESCLFKREYKVPAELVKAGKAVIAVRVMDTGGMGGILGDENELRLEASDGTTVSLSGEWKFSMGLGLGEAPVFPVNTVVEPNYPTFLYNAMIHPLVEFPIAGAIWYQGESNASRAAQYKDLLPLMIEGWRRNWGYDFPFYIAQIANYMEAQTGAEESEWAELREAQLQTLNLENTGMAVLIDVGEAFDIHPKNKVEVGRRLALNALACTYGQNIPYSGPIYDGYCLEGNQIRISFTHTDGGLNAAGSDVLEGFYVAGPDHVFHKAEACIEGDTVVVSSENVPFPVAVRYAWANNPVCNLYNGAGLPASPFRTDAWTR